MVIAFAVSTFAGVPPASSPEAPAPAQAPPPYTAFPSLDPDDGKFMAVAGQGLSTLAGLAVVANIGLPAGTASFEIGLFDGDTDGHWDLRGGSPVVVYKVYADPLKNGTKANLVSQWTSADASDDAWYTRTFTTGTVAQAPSGNYFYRLEANWAVSTSTSFNNFKIRTTGQISLKAGQEFGFAGGPQRIPPYAADGSECPASMPPHDPPVGAGDPHPGDLNDADANSYDGDWSWFFYVPTEIPSITFRDGDADRWDDDQGGAPPDDGNTYGACARVPPSIFYEITDPAGNVYVNGNPSGDQEWEDFLIGPDPGSNVQIDYDLSPGLWRFRVRGMDAHNFNVLRASHEIYSTPDIPLTVNPKPLLVPDHVSNADPETTVTYAHTVTNQGAPDAFDLTATSSLGWTTRIYHDANGDGAVDPGDPIVSRTPQLGTGASYPILVQVDVPLTLVTKEDVTTVRASSRTEWALQDEATDTTRVKVNERPTADAGGPYVAAEGNPITFDASGSFDPDGDPLTYEWDWEADGFYDAQTTDPVISHTFGDDLRDHPVLLRVSDGQLASTTTALVNVVNVAPFLSILTAPAGPEGDLLLVRARARDPGSDDLSFTWWGHCDGWPVAPVVYLATPGTPDPFPSPDVNPRDVIDERTFTCGDNGSFTLNLRVEDDDGGAATTLRSFSVSNRAPDVSVTGDFAVDEAATASLEATATDAGSDDLTFTWRWDFGPTESRTYFADGAGPDPPRSWEGPYPVTASDASSHTYGDDCLCVVSLTVEDDDGGTTIYEATVEVRNLPPAIEAGVTAAAAGDLRLRVAGEKWHDVTLTLYPNGLGAAGVVAASIVRVPGSPDDQSASAGGVTIDLFAPNPMAAVVEYTPLDDPINGQVNGANPAWLILTAPTGEESRLHHTFNVRHERTWTWIVPDFRAFLIGFPIAFDARASDQGSDDLTFAWDFGDGGTATTTSYNDGAGPDPFPSPDVNPILATSSVSHAFGEARVFPIVLTVTDDDGGATTASVSLDLRG